MLHPYAASPPPQRTGSSLPAIKKFIDEKHGKELKDTPHWDKILSTQLKRLSASGKLVKVKASYKLGEELKVRRACARTHLRCLCAGRVGREDVVVLSPPLSA